MSYVNTQSTVRLQKIVNIAKAMGDLNPILNVAGTSVELPLAIANDVMSAICALPFPFKFNEINLPVFYSSSYQQDYALIYPNGTSVTNLSWLERGIVIDINNLAQPKPFRNVECGRQLQQATGVFWNSATSDPLFQVNYFPNNTLYYGTWGQPQGGNSSFGNNPVAGSVYQNPVGVPSGFMGVWNSTTTYNVGNKVSFQNSYWVCSNTSTGNLPASSPTFWQATTIAQVSQPANPITQIQDANGNFLVLTTYGVTGNSPPSAPANSSPGVTVNDGTCVWTVVDPYGQGIRVLPVPPQTGLVWEFNLTGQMLPKRFTSLNETLFPIPDQYESNFRQGFVAQCYRYSPEAKIRAKFKDEWALWLASMYEIRAKSDRELEENVFTPDRGIMSGVQGRRRWDGPAWPFNYPVS